MTNSIKKIPKDVLIVLLLSFICIYTVFNLSHWKKDNRIVIWDVVGYYAYLPATFIYGDVTLKHPNENFEKYQHTFWDQENLEGKTVFKYSMGMSMLYAPFFFLSHLYTLTTDGIASGFSPPYKFGLAMSSVFYFILGLFYLRKFLRLYFSEKVVAFTLFFIGLGTNLYYYTVLGVGLPHTYLFCLLSITAYLTSKWYKNPTLIRSMILGILVGLMILVRPTMIVVVPFIALFNINSINGVKERITYVTTHLFRVIISVLFSLMVWIPQLLYWKIASGDYIYYSYTDEGFFFNDPQLLNVLFSFRNGWLLYTPIMCFSLFGLFWMVKKGHKMALGIAFTVGLYLYIASCWWTWWFGGSFGFRTMIDMYPLLAIGMAYFIGQIIEYKKIVKASVLTLMFLLLGFNLFQTRQVHEGLLHHDSMTKEAYFKILFKLKPQITIEELELHLKHPNYDAAKKGNRDQ